MSKVFVGVSINHRYPNYVYDFGENQAYIAIGEFNANKKLLILRNIAYTVLAILITYRYTIGRDYHIACLYGIVLGMIYCKWYKYEVTQFANRCELVEVDDIDLNDEITCRWESTVLSHICLTLFGNAFGLYSLVTMLGKSVDFYVYIAGYILWAFNGFWIQRIKEVEVTNKIFEEEGE